MKKIIVILGLLVSILPTTAFGQLIACRDSIKDGYDFWLYLPDDYNDTVRDKPVVMFLHGKSLSGKNLAMVRRYGCIDALSRGLDIDAIVVAPQAQSSWEPQKVMDVYNWVARHYAVDANRFYVLGMSMGGYGTLDFVATYPEKVAAGIALCGGSTKKDLCGLNEVPLWIVHGTADTAIPVRCSQQVVDAMCQCGDTSRLLFDKLKNENHSRLARIFYLEQTYDWLFSHSLSDPDRVANKDYTISSAIMANAYSGLSKRDLNVIDKPTYSANAGKKYHVVKSGDTLSKIAVEHNTTVTFLCKLNNLKRTDNLRVGRKIRIK